MSFKGERCTNGKKSKERITILLGANMTGNEKLPLLVIGKSLNPRCFKGSILPVEYTANKKAWMTSFIFEKWLLKWDKNLQQNNRKILLFIDNASAHSISANLNNIKICFFLANTTAASQPMDQGVIQNFKVHYKKDLLSKHINAFDTNITLNFNLLDSLHCILRAWNKVLPETIKNCFIKAKFIINKGNIESTLITNNEDLNDSYNVTSEECNILWQSWKEKNNLRTNIHIQDYLYMDDNLITDGIMSLEDIVLSNKKTKNVVEDNDDSIAKPDICYSDVKRTMGVVHQYIIKNADNIRIYKIYDELNEIIEVNARKNMKQSTLFDNKLKKL